MSMRAAMKAGLAKVLTRGAGTLAGAGAALIASGMALAQTRPAEVLRAPSPGRSPEPPTLWMVLFGLIIVALVVAASLIPSRRGHQD